MAENKDSTDNLEGAQQGPQLVPFSALTNSQEKAAGANAELRKAATTDALTGALNRHGLEVYMSSAESPRAVLWVDSTNFKAINDEEGHNKGDEIIIETYNVLKASVRPHDVISRWGGDEFVIILNGIEQNESDGLSDTQEDLRATVGNDPEQMIIGAKARIAEKMQAFLDLHPELKKYNFDLAVGGTVWQGPQDLNKFVDALKRAEEDMGPQKDEQHARGQYRVAS